MIFTATFSGVAVSAAAQDLWTITAPTANRLRLLELIVGQYSDAAELLRLQIIAGYTAAGTGGSAVTPANLKPWGPAASAFTGLAVARNHTTIASVGTAVIKRSDPWNIEAGYIWRPMRDRDFSGAPSDAICVEGAGLLVIRLPTAPTDEISMDSTIVFEVLPRGNL